MTRLEGDVVGVEYLSGSASRITTATSTTSYIGECDSCLRPVRGDLDEDKGQITVITCPESDCRKEITAERIVIETTNLACSESCHGAYRKLCRCACNGSNHARLWSMRIGAKELTEAEALEQRRFLLKYYDKQIATLERQVARDEKATRQRAAAFNAWLSIGDHEELVADLLGTKHPNLEKYQFMVEQDELLRPHDERTVREILLNIKVKKLFS